MEDTVISLCATGLLGAVIPRVVGLIIDLSKACLHHKHEMELRRLGVWQPVPNISKQQDIWHLFALTIKRVPLFLLAAMLGVAAVYVGTRPTADPSVQNALLHLATFAVTGLFSLEE